jgi:hypothetical protein
MAVISADFAYVAVFICRCSYNDIFLYQLRSTRYTFLSRILPFLHATGYKNLTNETNADMLGQVPYDSFENLQFKIV